MPRFRLDGPARDYPFARDAQGANLGRVEPGDVREFETAPDQWWAPADGDGSGDGEPGTSGDDSPADERDAGEPDGSAPQEHDDGPDQPADPDA